RSTRVEVFALDHLGDAVKRLYERYAELLPDGDAGARATATARSIAVLVPPFRAPNESDADRIADAIDPGIEFVDHRPLGFESTRGAEQLRARLRTLRTVATDVQIEIDDILGLRSNGILVRWTQRGTVQASGGKFETTLLICWILAPDGLAIRNELFPPDREAEALSRFDELTATPAAAQPAPQRRHAVPRNAATATTARIDAA